MDFNNRTYTILLLIVISISCSFKESKAQLVPLFSQSIRSQELLNPAFNSTKDYISALVTDRQQWHGINGNPKIMGVNIRFPLVYNNENDFNSLGIAINVVGETLGLRNNTIASFTVDANIRIMDQTFIGLGIRGGIDFFQYDITRLFSLEDPNTINNLMLKGTYPHIGIGLLLTHLNHRFGLSMLTTIWQNIEDNNPKIVPGIDFYYGAIFKTNDQLEIMPELLFKQYYNYATSLDLSVDLIIKRKLRVGIGNRLFESVFMRCGIKINEMFWLLYAYDYPIKGISIFGKGSHEISLAFGFNKNHNGGKRNNELR